VVAEAGEAGVPGGTGAVEPFGGFGHDVGADAVDDRAAADLGGEQAGVVEYGDVLADALAGDREALGEGGGGSALAVTEQLEELEAGGVAERAEDAAGLGSVHGRRDFSPVLR
jgi:hypothetical protein